MATRGSAMNLKQTIFSELKRQVEFAVPLIPINSTWFVKTIISTVFLGRLGELELAAGTLGLTFANVTGISILTGLCWAIEPICGQAHGAGNRTFLHRTLLMVIILLLVTCVPVSILWLYVDKVLLLIGQQREIASVAKRDVICFLPDLIATSFFYPIKGYLSAQGITLPTFFSSLVALAFHVPLNILLSKAKGIEGVALATGLTDFIAAITLASYALVSEVRKWRDNTHGKAPGEEGGGWWKQKLSEWLRLLSLAMQCCITGCLEWWCYEILILLAGRTQNAQRAVSVLTVVLNLDYLLYAFNVSLATCASTRASNELGAGGARASRNAVCVSLGLSFAAGCTGALAIVSFRGFWGTIFSHDKGVGVGVRETALIMALVEVFNFPLATCGGILRATSTPSLGMCSVIGFYRVGLPSAVVLSFKAGLGVGGLLLGFLVGCASGAILLFVLVLRTNWVEEAGKAQKLACTSREVGDGNDVGVVITQRSCP